MPGIARVVIFGDSLSDIGNMQARMIGGMSGVNEHGRFSDGKNWVDFFWEGLGGSSMFCLFDPAVTVRESAKHRTMTDMAFRGKKLQLVNYAEGGAIGWGNSEGVPMSKMTTYGALSSLDAQVSAYLRECTSDTTSVDGSNTLHIVWVGANDIVTINRAAKTMAKLATNVKNQIARLFDKIWKSHVLVIDLPALSDMPRFKALVGEELTRITETHATYNRQLTQQMRELAYTARTNWKMGSVNYFKISEIMTETMLGRWGFAPFAKPWTSPSGVGIGADLAEVIPFAKFADIALDESSEFATTEDELHPTEGVYRAIAGLVTKHATGQGFTFA